MLERLGRPSNYWFRRWPIDGTLERLNRALGERSRAQLGKKAAQPEEDLDHYVHNPPEVILASVSQAFTGICGGPLREAV